MRRGSSRKCLSPDDVTGLHWEWTSVVGLCIKPRGFLSVSLLDFVPEPQTLDVKATSPPHLLFFFYYEAAGKSPEPPDAVLLLHGCTVAGETLGGIKGQGRGWGSSVELRDVHLFIFHSQQLRGGREGGVDKRLQRLTFLCCEQHLNCCNKWFPAVSPSASIYPSLYVSPASSTLPPPGVFSPSILDSSSPGSTPTWRSTSPRTAMQM